MAMIHDSVRPSSTLFFVSLIFIPMASSVTDSEALLKLKQSFTTAEALNSWKPDTSPCNKIIPWVGVVCYINGVVTGLRLNGLNLSGKIDVDALLQIPGLRTLSFSFNNFSGPIPEFNSLGALKAIYLMGNQFSGEISRDYFLKMVSLKKLWLSSNSFSGPIPLSLGQLPHLIELHLNGNQFSGVIPPLEQPTLMSLDLSDNNLKGEIPQSLSRFNLSSFQGNPALCGGKLGVPCTRPINAGDEDNSKVVAYGFLMASSIMILLMVCGIFALRRKPDSECTAKEKESILEESSVGVQIVSSSKKELSESKRRFSMRRGSNRVGDLVIVNNEKGEFGLADMMKASAEVLGNGTLGACYKAFMYSGLTVVVKRIKEMNKAGKDVFDAEIRRMGRLKHKNILPPLAYHFRKEEKLLVYEYMPNGCLLYQLHAERGPSHGGLNWPTRLKIVQGIAQGLGYLHTELSYLDVPHGNLKSSNVLLSLDNEAILVDYGYDCLINSQAKQSLSAYRSPEVVQYQQVSPKCDVYCLGVIILEIVTGKFPSQYLNSVTGGIDVVQWAKSAIAEGKEAEVFDPEIASSRNSLGEMEKLLHIGAACAENNPEQRLEIREAIKRIEEIQTEGCQKAISFHILPSLKDGCADSVDALPSQNLNNAPQGYGDGHSTSIDIEDKSGHRCDSFVFLAS